MKLLVSNLSNMTTSGHLRQLFNRFGKVINIKITTEAFSGRSIRYAVIRMDDIAARLAISRLNCINFMNHFIEIEPA